MPNSKPAPNPMPTQPGLGGRPPAPTNREGGMGWGVTPPGGGGGLGWGTTPAGGAGLGGLQGLLGSPRGGLGTPSTPGGHIDPMNNIVGDDGSPYMGVNGPPIGQPGPAPLAPGDLGGAVRGLLGGAPAPARAGFQQGNRGAQKGMGGSPYAALRTAPTEGGQPPAPASGITSDPGPAGGGLQSLLARARAMSPYGRG